MSNNIYKFSESYQLKILSLLARRKDIFITYREVIKPQYFRKDIHIDLARIIFNFYDTEIDRSSIHGTEVNSPTFDVLIEEVRKLCKGPKAKLAGQYALDVADLVEMDLSDAEYVKDSIIAFGKRSAIEHAILASVDVIEKGTEDYSDIEDMITKAIRVGDDISDLGTDFFEDAESRMKIYSTGTDGVRRIPTGMAGLDKVMHGGLGDGELGVVIAPPNRGKSIALINIGSGAVMEGYNVAHITLEMPEKQVAKRYDGRLTKKNFDYMKENSSKVLGAILNIQKLHKGKLHIKKFPANTCTVNTIKSYLTRLYIEKGFKPDLIIVDYGDLMQPLKSYKDKRFEVESVYLDLRELGCEYSCPVWTASQTNRGGLDKKIISIGDLAEAFNKANIADCMVALCQTLEEKEDGTMRIHVAKHRDGVASITLPADIDYPTYNLTVYNEEK